MGDSALKSRPGRQRTDFSLLLKSVEKKIREGHVTEDVSRALSNEKLWKQLSGEDATRWAHMAQMAGLVDLSLSILEWVNSRRPDLETAWRERLEILGILDRREEVVRVRALAAAYPGGKAVPVSPPILQGATFAHEHSEAPKKTWGPPAPVGHFMEEDLPPPDASQKPAPVSSHVFAAQTGQVHPQAPPRGVSPPPSEQPFLELRREERLLNLYMDIFQGRRDVFAGQWFDAGSSSQGYTPVRRPFLLADVRDHLKGKHTHGIYLMREDHTVMVGVIDVDLDKNLRDRPLSREQKQQVRSETRYLLKRLLELSNMAAMPCVLEFSGGKGYHAWYSMEKPVPAGRMRKALLHLAGEIGKDLRCFNMEVFPKQDRLTGAGLGNLVKLPLGVHRVTGKPSAFIQAPDRTLARQLEYLEKVPRIAPEALDKAAGLHEPAAVVVPHPRYAAWAEEYPELARLESRCDILAHILAQCRGSKTLSTREEKILLGTVGFLPRARALLHHIFSALPEYNRPLLDFKISRIRGTALGCKRIHSIMGDGEGGIPCRFESMDGYPHPLLHLGDLGDMAPNQGEARGERTENLQDALENLAVAMKQVQRFLSAKSYTQEVNERF